MSDDARILNTIIMSGDSLDARTDPSFTQLLHGKRCAPLSSRPVVSTAQVDHLRLKQNRRRVHKRIGGEAEGAWESAELNPRTAAGAARAGDFL